MPEGLTENDQHLFQTTQLVRRKDLMEYQAGLFIDNARYNEDIKRNKEKFETEINGIRIKVVNKSPLNTAYDVICDYGYKSAVLNPITQRFGAAIPSDPGVGQLINIRSGNHLNVDAGKTPPGEFKDKAVFADEETYSQDYLNYAAGDHHDVLPIYDAFCFRNDDMTLGCVFPYYEMRCFSKGDLGREAIAQYGTCILNDIEVLIITKFGEEEGKKTAEEYSDALEALEEYGSLKLIIFSHTDEAWCDAFRKVFPQEDPAPTPQEDPAATPRVDNSTPSSPGSRPAEGGGRALRTRRLLRRFLRRTRRPF
jgi:hypothetical protein